MKIKWNRLFFAGMAGCICCACTTRTPEMQLAETILGDSTLMRVDSMARSLIRQGFNAGSGYSQIWARDMNTFIETACEENDPAQLRQAILLFFALQQPNGEMIDGYVLKPDFTWHDDTPYYSDAAPDHVAFKNTVETDQESSLIQIVGKYVDRTGDSTILYESVAGSTVLERMDEMVEYLLRERFDESHGLLFGAMTADWGDVQPNDDFGCDMNELSVRAIDVYDNAMFLIALDHLQALTDDPYVRNRYAELHDRIAKNVRTHLWDTELRKFRPHVYIDPSPVPEDFDERQVHYHGGTAVAIEAGLLSEEEIRTVNAQMLENVRLSGMPSIGLTLYPPYPEGFFHGGMAQPYVYQNGGDWTWFGGRMIQQLVANGMVEEAYAEVRPMIDRVLANGGFYEWYGMGGVPSGSGQFKGSAGVLAKAIEMMRQWAEKQVADNQ